MLDGKQIYKLYNTMKNLILNRQDTDKLEELKFSDFTEWINKLVKQYIEEEEKEDIYKYCEDNIFDTVCYE
jgi:hypothetical protein